MPPTLAPGRPADRKNEIVRALRQRIVSGALPPGERLPTRSELVHSFDASSVTVQRALDQLIRDGFVRVAGRQGTFVAPEPPHLHRYAVVFPALPASTKRWVRFWSALNHECLELQAAGRRNLSVFYGIGGPKRSEEWEQLEQSVLAHRVAGLIFASSPHVLEGTPLLDEPGIPRVAIKTPNSASPIPAVSTDRESFYIRALEHLAKAGRKRVAFVSPIGGATRVLAQQKVAEFGLVSHPYWWQVVPLHEPEAACNCVHLLMHPGQAERPDGLIFCDDNFVEAATAGLLAAGARVPQDVEVVAHCNFPWPASPVVPMRRLGFDARRVLRACFESIDAQRRGESVPYSTLIDAQFEDELPFGEVGDEFFPENTALHA